MQTQMLIGGRCRALARATPAPSTPEESQLGVAEESDGRLPEDSDGITWDDLESLTIEIAGEPVALEAGSATVSYGGASESVFTLQNRVAQGDLDGDGDDDLVAHVIERSPGSGVFHLLVPVINDGGTPVARRPVPVGDRIVMDAISARDGLIEVALYDRALDEPFTVITQRTTLEIDLAAVEPEVRTVGVDRIESLPLPGAARPEIEVRFDPGAVSAQESGSIDFRERQQCEPHPGCARQPGHAVPAAALRVDRCVHP